MNNTIKRCKDCKYLYKHFLDHPCYSCHSGDKYEKANFFAIRTNLFLLASLILSISLVAYDMFHKINGLTFWNIFWFIINSVMLYLLNKDRE